MRDFESGWPNVIRMGLDSGEASRSCHVLGPGAAQTLAKLAFCLDRAPMSSDNVTVRTRRSQEQRSAEMRERLYQATLDLICEVGFERLTTSMIAQRAKVSKGAQTHHFPTKNDLLVGAFTYLIDKWDRERVAFETSLPHPIAVEDYIRYLWKVVFSKPLYIASIELMLAARSDDELRDRIQSILGDWIEIRDTTFWRAVSTELSKEDASVFLQLTLCVLRGMAIHASFNKEATQNDVLFEAWLDIAKERIAKK